MQVILKREVLATKTIKIIFKTLRVHVDNALNSNFVPRMHLLRTLSNITQFGLVIKGFGLRVTQM